MTFLLPTRQHKLTKFNKATTAIFTKQKKLSWFHFTRIKISFDTNRTNNNKNNVMQENENKNFKQSDSESQNSKLHLSITISNWKHH